MSFTDLPIELHSEPEIGDELEHDLFVAAEESIRELAEGHKDITGAAIDITQPAESRETSFVYEVSVVLYTRPKNIAATKKHEDAMSALRDALKAAGRQVREKRERLRNY